MPNVIAKVISPLGILLGIGRTLLILLIGVSYLICETSLSVLVSPLFFVCISPLIWGGSIYLTNLYMIYFPGYKQPFGLVQLFGF